MNVEGYHDTPFMSAHESGTFGIDLGVDVGLSSAVEPRVMSTPGAHLARKKQHGSAVKSMGAEDVDDAARSVSAVLEDKRAEDVDSAARSGQNFQRRGGSETLDDSSSSAISAEQCVWTEGDGHGPMDSVSTKPVSAATSNALVSLQNDETPETKKTKQNKEKKVTRGVRLRGKVN